jgi:hypothetical protein
MADNSTDDFRKGYRSIQRAQSHDMQPALEESADWKKGYWRAQSTCQAELQKTDAPAKTESLFTRVKDALKSPEKQEQHKTVLDKIRNSPERSDAISNVALAAAKAIKEGKISAEAVNEYKTVKDKEAYIAGMKAGNLAWAKEHFAALDRAIEYNPDATVRKTHLAINNLNRENTIERMWALHRGAAEPTHNYEKGAKDYAKLIKAGANLDILDQYLRSHANERSINYYAASAYSAVRHEREGVATKTATNKVKDPAEKAKTAEASDSKSAPESKDTLVKSAARAYEAAATHA